MCLDKLKRRLGIDENAKDGLLNDLLADAQAFTQDYTGRVTLPQGAEGVLVELACIAYNRLGMEGQSSHSEGGVSASVDGLPGMLKARLDRLRVAKVG